MSRSQELLKQFQEFDWTEFYEIDQESEKAVFGCQKFGVEFFVDEVLRFTINKETQKPFQDHLKVCEECRKEVLQTEEDIRNYAPIALELREAIETGS